MAFPRRSEKKKDEFDKRTIEIRRVTRVTGGGKRFKFRTTVAVGDHMGKVGIGTAKSSDVSQSIEKATRQAKKSMFVLLLKDGTVPHEVSCKYRSAMVILKPSKKGKGIIAGGPMRMIAALAGIESVTGKILSRTKNKLNIAQATMGALKKLKIHHESSPAAAEHAEKK
jgi:small subunit ribosomal protein S5